MTVIVERAATTDRQAWPGKWSHGQTVALVIILLLSFAVRSYLLHDQGLWYDESNRVFIASLPILDVFRTMAQEGLQNLPLPFVLHKPFMRPFDEFTVRFPSACSGVLAVAVVAQLGCLLWGRDGGLIAASILALNPFHVWFSRDAGFYALVALSSIGSLYFFLRLLTRQSPRNLAGLAVFTALGICTHYFAFALPVVEMVYLAVTLRRNDHVLRPWLLSQVIAFLPLTPWYAFLLRRGEFYFGHGALGPPQPVEIIYTLWNFSIGYTGKPTLLVILALSAFLGAVSLGMVALFKHRRHRAILLVLWLFLPITLTFLMALRQPMYVDRYLMPAFPAYLLLAVGGLLKLGKTGSALGLTALLLVSALGTARIYCDPIYHKEDWRSVAEHIEQHEEPGDLMMPLLYQSLTPLLGQYYDGDTAIEPVWVGMQSRDPARLVEGHERVWLIIPQHHNSTHWLASCQPFDVLDPTNYASSHLREVRPWLEANLSELAWHHDFTCVSLLLFDMNSTQSSLE